MNEHFSIVGVGLGQVMDASCEIRNHKGQGTLITDFTSTHTFCFSSSSSRIREWRGKNGWGGAMRET